MSDDRSVTWTSSSTMRTRADRALTFNTMAET